MNKPITIGVVGNPNSGKTTVFNSLTGSTQKVGNWPGVTVEKFEGSLTVDGQQWTFIDLPGIYSLNVDSDDERVSVHYLLENQADVLLNVIDSTNLERNLYLTLQLREMGYPVMAVLTMADSCRKQNLQVDTNAFFKATGIPAFWLDATEKGDLGELRNFIKLNLRDLIGKKSQIVAELPETLEKHIRTVQDALIAESVVPEQLSRWTALGLLEGNETGSPAIRDFSERHESVLEDARKSLEEEARDDIDILTADARYRCIQDIAGKTVRTSGNRASGKGKLDAVLMHRIWGIPIFLGVMYLVFWFTMTVGGAFIDFFDIAFGALFVDGAAELLGKIAAPEWLIGVLTNGVGAGIQTVATFIPIIFTMFFALSLLEDSGYMTRAAFVMDRFMRSIGLPGKAFVPMLVGFGCTVPAVMATRTLDSKRDRLMTIFMVPLMSCGARLPVYAVFGAAFFAKRSGFLVFSLYIVGIILAVLTGLLLKNTIFRGEQSSFVMEIPAWHRPRWKNIFRSAGNRLKSFVLKGGKIIIPAVAVLSLMNTLSWKGTIGNDDTEDSILSSIGKSITPVFGPMGIDEDNWPATVGLFTGVFAKEVVVGTLNSLYTAESGSESEAGEEFVFSAVLLESLTVTGENLAGVVEGLKDPFGLSGIGQLNEEEIAAELETDSAFFQNLRERFSPAAAYAYLLFILIYFPCFAAMGAVFREAGRIYGTISLVYLTVLAWVVATLFYQIAEGGNILLMLLAGGIGVLQVGFFVILGRKQKRAGNKSMQIGKNQVASS